MLTLESPSIPRREKINKELIGDPQVNHVIFFQDVSILDYKNRPRRPSTTNNQGTVFVDGLYVTRLESREEVCPSVSSTLLRRENERKGSVSETRRLLLLKTSWNDTFFLPVHVSSIVASGDR